MRFAGLGNASRGRASAFPRVFLPWPAGFAGRLQVHDGGLGGGEKGGQIVRFHPREPHAAGQRYETESEAVRWFGRSLATSRRNGWEVVYDGVPLAG